MYSVHLLLATFLRSCLFGVGWDGMGLEREHSGERRDGGDGGRGGGLGR